jgi:hypothetical protein
MRAPPAMHAYFKRKCGAWKEIPGCGRAARGAGAMVRHKKTPPILTGGVAEAPSKVKPR